MENYFLRMWVQIIQTATLEFEFRKAKMVQGIEYCAYDTMKGFRTDDWSTIKQTCYKELKK